MSSKIIKKNKYLQNILVCLRSHGWARSLDNNSILYKEYCDKYTKETLPDDFLFLLPGFNLRTTDINSRLGITQLPKLKKFVNKRRLMNKMLTQVIDEYSEHLNTQTNKYNSSCFGFSLICRTPKLRVVIKESLQQEGFETRPIVTGNIMRHPVSKFFPEPKTKLPNADHIHLNGLFIGNFFDQPEHAFSAFRRAIKRILNE